MFKVRYGRCSVKLLNIEGSYGCLCFIECTEAAATASLQPVVVFCLFRLIEFRSVRYCCHLKDQKFSQFESTLDFISRVFCKQNVNYFFRISQKIRWPEYFFRRYQSLIQSTNSQFYMELEDALPCLQEFVIVHYPKTNQCGLHHHARSILILSVIIFHSSLLRFLNGSCVQVVECSEFLNTLVIR